MIYELEEMCYQQDFDVKKAESLMQQTDINQIFVSKKYDLGFDVKTILLECAANNANVAMTELLLKNGADPNLIYDDECVFWDLQYNDFDYDRDVRRLKIAQLFLEYGANPLIEPENNGENLFDDVVFAVFNDDYDEYWSYKWRFLILLIAYGAKSDYCTPRIVGEFDKTNMQQYHFCLIPAGENKYSGEIRDKSGNCIAYV